MRESFRVQHSTFFVSGPEVIMEIEEMQCRCRTWPIVLNTYEYDAHDERWKPTPQFVRSCGICGERPRPLED